MHGVINLDKPMGMSSQQAVSRVKRILQVKEAGHAGTLDPLATGVLLVCVGEATKISAHLMGMQKIYEAELHLGQRTDTLDAEGEILEERDVKEYSEQEINDALDTFRGVISQTPPMYSALKKDGQPLYKLARQGKTIKREPREVTIYDIESTGYEHPFLRIRVSCSKGTYIRTLAEDVAGKLSTIAFLSGLRRTRVGAFGVEESVTLEELEAAEGAGKPALVDIDTALPELKELILNDEDYARMRNGGFADPTRYGITTDGEALKIKTPDGLIMALGSLSNKRIKVDRMIHLKD